MTIRRRETVDEHARTIFIFLFHYIPLSFISLEKIIRFGIYVYMWSSTGDQIPGAGLSGGRVQETRNRRSPSDGEWGIIARLRSLREEDSMAASTTPGSNYRISPPSSSPPSYFQPKIHLPSPFYFSSTRCIIIRCVHLPARWASSPASLSLSFSRAIGLDQKPAWHEDYWN